MGAGVAFEDGLELWDRWRAPLAAGWVPLYRVIEETLYAAEIVLAWWAAGLIELRGERERFGGEAELIAVRIDGRSPKFYRLDEEGLKHLSSGVIHYSLELRLDRDFLAAARDWVSRDQAIEVIGAPRSLSRTITIPRPDPEAVAWLNAGEEPARPPEPAPVELAALRPAGEPPRQAKPKPPPAPPRARGRPSRAADVLAAYALVSERERTSCRTKKALYLKIRAQLPAGAAPVADDTIRRVLDDKNSK